MGIDLRDVEQPIGTLSGGERQCVAIARAVYFGARVLILDEPTAALGVRQSGVVLKYIAKARDRGLGVIFITHNPHHAYPVGDRFMLLRRGRSMGNFPKAEMTLDELVQMMAGGAELEALSHELAREMPDSEVAKEHGGRGGGDARDTGSDEPTRTSTRPVTGSPGELGVAVVGFGWMGQVHARAWARLLQHYPGRAAAPAASWPWPTPTPAAATRRASTSTASSTPSTTGASCWSATTSTWSACADRTSCTARSAIAVAASGRAPLDREAGRSQRRGHRARSRRPSQAAGVQSRGRASTTATLRRSSVARELVAAGRARRGRVRRRADARRLLRAPRRGAVVAVRPGVRRHRRAGRPGQPRLRPRARTSGATAVGGDHRAGGRPGDVHHRAADAERAPCRTSRRRRRAARAGRQRGPSRRRCCASPRVPAARSTSSRVAVGEQCTLRHRRPRHRGCAVVGLPPDGRAPGLPRPGLPGRRLGDPARATRATATSRRSSPGSGMAMGYDDLKVVEADATGAEHRHRRAARRDDRRRRASRPSWSTRW